MRTLIWAALLWGCTADKDSGDPNQPDDSDALRVDIDGDGYGGSSDCDDASAGIYPGADERCNGLDDDCDGEVDEAGVIDGITAYPDADSDGFGAAPAETVCPDAAGYARVSGDCDDANNAVYPGQTEVCDGADNDCDSLTDEPGAEGGSTYHLDQDGDGFGHPTRTGTACAAGDGYVDDDTDCDDLDPARSPGLPELCNNDLDDDCDGTVDEADDAEAPTWYYDGDDDGYGTTSPSLESCEQPDGYARTSDDCDDADSSVHPGAYDRTDGLDNDCDGELDEGGVYSDTGTGTLNYAISLDSTLYCDYWWNSDWVGISEMCDDCEYAWDASFVWDKSGSSGDCGEVEDFAWTMGIDEDYAGTGEAILWYTADGREWYPSFYAELVDGGLTFEQITTYSYYYYYSIVYNIYGEVTFE